MEKLKNILGYIRRNPALGLGLACSCCFCSCSRRRGELFIDP